MSDDIKLQGIPSGTDGQGFVTIGGKVLDAFRIKKIDVTAEFEVESQFFAGDPVKQNAYRGVAYTGNLEYYNTTSAFKKAVRTYQNGGAFPDISVQYYVDSPAYGREEITVSEMVFDKIPMGGFDDSSSKAISQATTFKAHHIDLPEMFDE
nr:phage tail tube protein [uncultured Caproiciproducens sp.]